MDVTPLVPRGRQVIQSYGGGGFLVSGERHTGSLLVFPTATAPLDVAIWPDLTAGHLAAVFAAEPSVEVLLMGCGPQIRPLDPTIRSVLRERRIGIELMDTGAACRTYNVLMAEDRRVAAALIAVD